MNNPLISVILPVYNAAPYIDDAVKSILNQSYANFEFIIIDDGSTDTSAEIISNIKDSRIHFISQANCGMAITLNKGIELSKGEFIARQDADDISYPDRFQKQIDFLTNNPDVAIVGTWAKIIPENNKQSRLHKHATNDLELKFELMWNNPFVHSSMMIRKKCLDAVGVYDINKPSLTQDYQLWSRIANQFSVANISEVLMDYREVQSSISRITSGYSEKVSNISLENIQRLLKSDSATIADLAYLYHSNFKRLSKTFKASDIMPLLTEIITKLVQQNKGGNAEQLKQRINILNASLTKKLKRYRQLGPYLYHYYYSLYRIYKRI